MAMCAQTGTRPCTPGEEGPQDMRIIAAIYESARRGRPVKVAAPSVCGRDVYRGPERA